VCYRSVSGEFDLKRRLLQYSFITKTHKFENTENNYKSRLDCFSQTPHSPELTPSDFSLFRVHRNTIHVERFGSDGEVIAEVKLLRTKL